MKLVVNEIACLDIISCANIYQRACSLKYEFHVSDLMVYKNEIDIKSIGEIFTVYNLTGDAMKQVVEFYDNCSYSIDFLDVITCYYASTVGAAVLTNEPLVKSIAHLFKVDYLTITDLQNKLLMQNTG